MTPQLIYNHSIEDSDIHNLCEDLVQYSDIAPKYYERFDVKRGLRNADGSGVIAGITRICMVHGYVMSEGERQPIPGQLIYRGQTDCTASRKEEAGSYGTFAQILLISSNSSFLLASVSVSAISLASLLYRSAKLCTASITIRTAL